MVKEARSLEFHDENLDAIPWHQPMRTSTPSPSYNRPLPSTPSTSQNNNDDDDAADDAIKSLAEERVSLDGALSTFITQECNRNLNTANSSSSRRVGEQPPVWLFLCFALMCLALLTLVGRELTLRLGPDHWAIGIINSTTVPLKSVLL